MKPLIKPIRNTIILSSLFIAAVSAFAQNSTNAVTTPPPIPEEARKHFVMGTTLFKDAKTPDDYSQVVSEFKQSADLAPQWPEARYNLALAEEAATNYSGAEADLKLYQQFKLSDDEARTVQDKIYALEAKQEEAAKRAADEQAKAQANAANSLDGARFVKDSSFQNPNFGLFKVENIFEIQGGQIVWTSNETPPSGAPFPPSTTKRTALLQGHAFTISDSAGDYTGTISDDGSTLTVSRPGTSYHGPLQWVMRRQQN